MRKRLKNLKNKSGHSENGAPRSLIDEAVYREHGAHVFAGSHYDSQYAGWSWASRPRDQPIFVRKHFVTSVTGPSAPSGPT
jgi:hypothetical protein